MTARRVWLSIKTPLTMLLLLGLVLFAAAWGYRNATAPIPPRPPEPCVDEAVGPKYLPSHAVLRLYNGTETNGFAKRAATILRADGFRVIRIANAPQQINGVTVVGVNDKSPEVVLVRSYLPNATFIADPNKLDHVVDITVGKGFTGFAKNPLDSVPLPNGHACIPRIQAGAEADS